MHQGTILVEPGDTLIFPQGSVKVMLADAAAEAGKTKTINVELKWTFTEGADSAPPGVSNCRGRLTRSCAHFMIIFWSLR